MLSNTQLSPRDFEISFQLKLAMNAMNNADIVGARESVTAALVALHAE